MKVYDRLIILLYPKLEKEKSKIFYYPYGVPLYEYFKINDAYDLMIETEDELLKQTALKESIKLVSDNNKLNFVNKYKQIIVYNGRYLLDDEKVFRKLTKLKKGKIQLLNSKKQEVCTIYNQNYNMYKIIKDKIITYDMFDNVDRAKYLQRMNDQIINKWIRYGVIFDDPTHTYISPLVVFCGQNHILPGTIFYGKTIIGQKNVIGPHSVIENSIIKDYNKITLSKLSNVVVGSNKTIGPFANLKESNDEVFKA